MGKVGNFVNSVGRGFRAYLANQDLRNLTGYMLFVFVFSYVTFSGKPAGQYELTQMALQKYATCDNENAGDFCEIEDEESMYGWLMEDFPGVAFPQNSYDGTFFDRVTKLFILGQSRFMGAIRLRQVRTILDDCEKVPSWLTDVPDSNGTITLQCTQELSGSTEFKEPYGLRSANLGNFTKPFTYQTVGELNTTDLGSAFGQFATYYQSGYALDIVPNLAPAWFAEKVQQCMPLLQESIDQCATIGIKEPPPSPMPPPPPFPPPPGNDDEPGIRLTSYFDSADLAASERMSGEQAWVERLSYDFIVSAENYTDEFAFKFSVHNTRTTANLNYASSGQEGINWITQIDPETALVEQRASECSQIGDLAYTCSGSQTVLIKVKADAQDFESLQAQAASSGLASTTVAATASNATITLKHTFNDLADNIDAEVSLTMSYHFVNNISTPANRRRAQSTPTSSKPKNIMQSFSALGKLIKQRRFREWRKEGSKPVHLQSSAYKAWQRKKEEANVERPWAPSEEELQQSRLQEREVINSRRRVLLQDTTEDYSTCSEKEELKLQGQSSLSYEAGNLGPDCVMVEDPLNTCELDYMGFQMLLHYASDNSCGLCKCTLDPEGDCEFDDSEEADGVTHIDGWPVKYERSEEDTENSTFVDKWAAQSEEDKACYCQLNCNPQDVYAQQMELLVSHKWTDVHTRGIILDLTVLDQNFNWFTVIRLLMEFPEMGGHAGVQFIFPYQLVSTFRLFRYVTAEDAIVLGLEVLFVMMIVAFTAIEFLEIRQLKWEYFKDGWSYVDMANVVIFWTVVLFRVLGIVLISKFDFDSLTVEYIDFPPLAVIATAELNIGAFNFFLMYFKFFKYLNQIPRMDSILLTVSNAAFDLFLFAIMFLIVTYSFAAAFYIVFSADVEEFSTLLKCFTTLLNYLLGDFDYGALYEVNSIMGPVLFYLYNFLVFFILLNMFLAIIADSYAEVKGNQTEEDLKFYYNLKDSILDKVNVLFKKKETVHELAQELMRADGDLDDMIDEGELEKALAANPAAYSILKVSGAKELLQKYDVSGDGVLDKSEMTQILRELAEKEAEIQAEMETAKGELADINEKVEEGGGEGGEGGYMPFNGAITVDTSELEQRIDKVEGQIKEMSRNIAKKLSLMIDLMMSLSDQVSSVSSMPAGGNQQIMPVVR